MNNQEHEQIVDALNQDVQGRSAAKIVEIVVRHFSPQRIVLASSMSIEDQVLTDMVCSVTASPRIFTLDTGRLFPETYDTIEKTHERYGFRYEILAPDTEELEQMVCARGPNLFYRSVALRKQCCCIRKTNPIRRVLSTVDAWVCGLRRGQAVTRNEIKPVEWDAGNGIVKVNPLFDWSETDVWQYIHKHGVPYNPLQDQGFRSIGCAPCTRAIGVDDDIRSGRWWWEEPEHKECGLHRTTDYQI